MKTQWTSQVVHSHPGLKKIASFCFLIFGGGGSRQVLQRIVLEKMDLQLSVTECLEGAGSVRYPPRETFIAQSSRICVNTRRVSTWE